MKECGHTFCKECANYCVQTGNCPTCRAPVTDSNPNFYARESIELLDVHCSHGKNDDGSIHANSRRRGNDGEIILDDRCNWIGPLKDLKNHEDACAFKVILCPHDDCNHECCKKDMHGHLAFHRQNDSIKADYERQMQEMSDKMNKKMKKKVKEMQEKMDSVGDEIELSLKANYERRIQEMSDKMNKTMEEKVREMQQKIDLMEKKIAELEGGKKKKHKAHVTSCNASDRNNESLEQVAGRKVFGQAAADMTLENFRSIVERKPLQWQPNPRRPRTVLIRCNNKNQWQPRSMLSLRSPKESGKVDLRLPCTSFPLALQTGINSGVNENKLRGEIRGT